MKKYVLLLLLVTVYVKPFSISSILTSLFSAGVSSGGNCSMENCPYVSEFDRITHVVVKKPRETSPFVHDTLCSGYVVDCRYASEKCYHVAANHEQHEDMCSSIIRNWEFYLKPDNEKYLNIKCWLCEIDFVQTDRRNY